MMKLYGNIVSRASRCLWMLDELGLEYDHVSLDWIKQEHLSDEFLKINPEAKVPALVDGDTVLSESIAINLYLAQKYRTNGLWPDREADQAKCFQWSFWAAAELEPVTYQRYREYYFKNEDQRDFELIKKVDGLLVKLLDFVEHSIAGSPYLLGDAFTAADLNVSVVMEHLERSEFDYTGRPRFHDWYKRCYRRPANQKIQETRAPHAEKLFKMIKSRN